MANRVTIDNMADEINGIMQEYAELAADKMKSAVQKAAKLAKTEISANAPKDTGTYQKSWKTKKTFENSQSLQMTVYSSNRYQLAHLLEKGHQLRCGGHSIGNVPAKVHIAPAEENAENLLLNLIEEALEE